MSERFTLAEAVCPSCGEGMQQGYIAGQWVPLRWTERPDPKTIFAGEPLHGVRLRKTGSIQAARCVPCGVGVFTFPQ